MAKPKSKSPTPSVGRERPGTAAARRAKLDAARKATKPGPNKIVIGTVVAVVAIIAVVTAVVLSAQHKKNTIAQGGKAVPAGAPAMGRGWVANSGVTLVDGAPTVAIFEDFRCPICQGFEQLFGEPIEAAAAAGKIKLVYHFKTIIDGNLGSNNSQVAASNALCAADQGAFFKYHNAMYAAQPKEGTLFTKEQFASFAGAAGLTGEKLSAFTECSAADKYMGYVASTEEASAKAGINGTPAFYINGQAVQWQSFATSAGQVDTAAFEKALTTGALTDAQKAPNMPKISD